MKILRNNGFTLIELMVVIVILCLFLAIALPNFFEAINRAKLASVKSNMKVIQVVVETYSIDYGGIYPDYLGNDNMTRGNNLYIDASRKGYWKEFKNPFSNNEGVDNSYIPFTLANYNITSDCLGYPELRIGQVGYKLGMISTTSSEVATLSPAEASSSSTSSSSCYYIFGGSQNDAQCISNKGKMFYLTNGNCEIPTTSPQNSSSNPTETAEAAEAPGVGGGVGTPTGGGIPPRR